MLHVHRLLRREAQLLEYCRGQRGGASRPHRGPSHLQPHKLSQEAWPCSGDLPQANIVVTDNKKAAVAMTVRSVATLQNAPPYLTGREAVGGAHGVQQPRHMGGQARLRVCQDERVVAVVVGAEPCRAHVAAQNRLSIRQPEEPTRKVPCQAEAAERGTS